MSWCQLMCVTYRAGKKQILRSQLHLVRWIK